ncbi:tetratricopeptide repeat protein [Orbaceae bacterium ac157xtp]
MKKLNYLLLPFSFLFLCGFTIDIPECNSDKDEYNLEQCESLAESGDPKAMFYYGYLYDEGKDVDYDFKLAAKWYKKSAEKGNSLAQLNLGFLYSVGSGVEKNDKKALEWYLKSAEQDNMHAKFNVARAYLYKSDSTKEELKQALEWLKDYDNDGGARYLSYSLEYKLMDMEKNN